MTSAAEPHIGPLGNHLLLSSHPHLSPLATANACKGLLPFMASSNDETVDVGSIIRDVVERTDRRHFIIVACRRLQHADSPFNEHYGRTSTVAELLYPV